MHRLFLLSSVLFVRIFFHFEEFLYSILHEMKEPHLHKYSNNTSSTERLCLMSRQLLQDDIYGIDNQLEIKCM